MSSSKDNFNRSDIESSLAKDFPDLTKDQIYKSIDVIVDSIVESVAKDEKVEIRGFGRFSIKTINAKYNARNPKTGEIIYVPEKKKVSFKMSKHLKQEINK